MAKKVSKKKKSPVKKVLKSLVKPPKPKKTTLNVKVLPAMAKEFQSIADKYCGGNFTALVKAAIPAFKPRSRDLVSAKK